MNVTLKHVGVTIVDMEKTIIIAHSECVSVALVIQHARHMCCIILPSVISLALQRFSTLSHKNTIFRKKCRTQNCVMISLERFF